MADIAEAIYSRLNGDATLTGKLNGGIYPYTPSVTPSRPYITYHLVSLSERPHAMNDDPPLVVDRYQVDVWADSYVKVVDVDNEVQRLLSRYRGTVAGVEIDSILQVDRRDLFEDEPELFRRSVDYEIAWKEA